MNYRHAYHAGNFADVFKHAFLLIALEHLKQKEKPFFVLDTHAGTGFYDLQGTQAGKTGEWTEGIGRLLDVAVVPDPLISYCNLVRRIGGDTGRFYPGSPYIVRETMRQNDRLALCELHPDDAALLSANMGRDPRVRVQACDGYTAIKAMLPPPERRGLVLIDPPFERRDEFQLMEHAVRDGLRRWASGTYALWYPVKDPDSHRAFRAALSSLTGTRIWFVELCVYPDLFPSRLNGCGLVFVNPPWSVIKAADDMMPFLCDVLRQQEGAFWDSGWCAGGA
ncbi:23S rRNA (adenine(2030)-N(6))-methyltransferase RlmJ [Haematospirillum sp. 15-248]|uniref:23S rRNA (adenine(2030)-N(6))-methyltransferase RlmJ n=1 Tax=Haematospirillum sp. 15-248 TaxID=2723107 RepID=UPI00143B6D37|nr:23S rRNA (adenine(2030)-N(6))-methyltransferase RlmJ [Haematospirillum sp. 15-248]NKD87203.1 23S rRNA (adenine(2030)-N(6))-methyltransferase RlmJ [Haematospirillum sp. 15-248]